MGDTRFCPQCGALVLPEDAFCGECGAALKAVRPELEPPIQPVPPPILPPAAPSVPVQPLPVQPPPIQSVPPPPVKAGGKRVLTALMVVGGVILLFLLVILLRPSSHETTAQPSLVVNEQGVDTFRYQHIRSADAGFKVAGVKGDVGFSMDIPTGWQRQEGVQEHELVFKSPDDTPESQMFLAVLAEPATKGHSAADVATAHITELRDMAADAEVLEQAEILSRVGTGQRAVLRYIGPSDSPGKLMTEMVVFQHGKVIYRLELTAPEPLWHTAQQAMEQALASLEFGS